METQLIEIETALPAQIEVVNAITAGTCLEYIRQGSQTLRDTNFLLLAAGVLAVWYGVLWAEKSARRTKDEMRSDLARAFGETDAPNSNAGRSKRYELARLCVVLAQHKLMKPLAIKAAQKESTELAASSLAAEFANLANSVAALARYFGTERSSGRRDPPKRQFLMALQALVKRSEQGGERIPLVDSVRVLAHAAGPSDVDSLRAHIAGKLF
jgi:hypothetical protein